MASGERIALNPSRCNLTQLSQQLKASRRGHKVLKHKADLIKCRLHQTRNEAKMAEIDFDGLFRQGMFAVAEAQYVNRHFKQMVLQASPKAPLTVVTTTEQVAGVTFEKFHIQKTNQDPFPHLGLSCGAQKIQSIKRVFDELLQIIVRMTSINAAGLKLDEAFRATATRVNGLEYITIPRYASAIRSVSTRNIFDDILPWSRGLNGYRFHKIAHDLAP